LDTQQRKKEVYRFIILVPHRDSQKTLDEYRARLFSIGVPGAFSFPMAAPLASVSRLFSKDELKELGRNIRLFTEGNDGKIFSVGSALTKLTTENTEFHGGKKDFSFFGPCLTLFIGKSLFLPSARAKITKILSPPVLCAALIGPKEEPPSEEGPVISFRAAALANLAIRPLESGAAGYSFEWKMGPLIWLPKANKVRI